MNFTKKGAFLKYGFLFSLFLLQSCANIVPPEGGEKDLTSPELIAIKPADSSLNQRVSKIELRFNKYMEVRNLEQYLQFSPLLRIDPTVTSYGKRVEIKIIDSLLGDSTTYRLSLGNALVDNREANPYKNFEYIYSTGPYFDSLQLQGQVFDAETGLPDSTAVIMLYDASASDSAVLSGRPVYLQKTDASGHFTVSFLPHKAFKIFAVTDDNNNYMYDFGTEKIDFRDTPLTADTASPLEFYVFKEQIDTLARDEDSAVVIPERFSGRKDARQKLKTQAGYKVNVDTFNMEKRTFDITRPLVIDHDTLSELDVTKVYLSYDDGGIEVEAVTSLIRDDFKFELNHDWKEDRLYTLRLVKGWAKDTAGQELLPGKYRFRTKEKNDYGTLKINIDSTFIGSDYVLFVYQEKDSIYQQHIKERQVSLFFLNPGNYNMRIFKDENQNGEWDTGNLFKKQHAERVIPHREVIVLRNAWENEVDFKVPEKNGDDKVQEKKEGRFER